MMTHLPLILGSSSRFRQQQLQTLQLSFTIASPHFDEAPFQNEAASDTALRLARGKAASLASAYPEALIIGADQVAWCNNRQIGKPMSVANAQQLLASLSGKTIDFYSAICLLNTKTGREHTHVDHTRVIMRVLNHATIARYLDLEPDAIYCAGGAKSEGIGAMLIERIDSQDPHALIGLPIFKLIDFLKQEHFPLPPFAPDDTTPTSAESP